jgi:hypothetical protein
VLVGAAVDAGDASVESTGSPVAVSGTNEVTSGAGEVTAEVTGASDVSVAGRDSELPQAADANTATAEAMVMPTRKGLRVARR